jgi:hypothetical protein
LLSWIQPVLNAGCFALLFFPSIYLNAEWRLSYIFTSSKEFNSIKLHYKNPSAFEWTHSELILTPSGLRFILNLTLCPLDAGPVQVIASTDLEERPLTGHLFEGGEKILLRPEDTSWLVHQLLEEKAVHLSIDRYKTTVASERFKEMWSKAKHLLLTNKIALEIK